MTGTASRKGGCGCGGGKTSSHFRTYSPTVSTPGSTPSPCGCKGDCGCGSKPNVREAPGGCCCEGPTRCGVPCLERPLYSPGQLLTADNLRLGQSYLEERFGLRRYVDGVGIVCGMHVRCDDEPGWIVVEPGYAIDCCGRDVILCEPVRFNACEAISQCERETDPCGDIGTEKPQPTEPAPPPKVELEEVKPGDEAAHGPVVKGKVTDAKTGQGIPNAQVTITMASGRVYRLMTDANGNYRSGNLTNEASCVVEVRVIGYSVTSRSAGLDLRKATTADFPLNAPAPAPKPSVPSTYTTYLLRIEGAWEGQEPVPVITNRGGCDPRPDCRPSKERSAVRLCVEPLTQRPSLRLAADRTSEFQKLTRELLEMFAQALDAVENAPDDGDDKHPHPRPEADAIAIALLDFIRRGSYRTSCNIEDLICDVRRLLRGDAARCFVFPEDAAPEALLVGFFGQLMDDLRESYLAIGCDDCCDYTGIRLGHIVTQAQLPDCGATRCSIAQIDSHVPAREALHPRSRWWFPDLVSVYDAYFRGAMEAAVMLTARGLDVTIKQANNSGLAPNIPNEDVANWIDGAGGDGVLSRLALYQRSTLYVIFGTPVTLWVVGSRVVAITTATLRGAAQPIGGVKQPVYASANYLMATMRPDRVVATLREMGAEGPRVAEVPEGEDEIRPEDLDPAPFKELIAGIGDRLETALYKRGKTRLADLVDTTLDDVDGRLSAKMLEKVKTQAREILAGRTRFPNGDLKVWAGEARERLALANRRDV